MATNVDKYVEPSELPASIGIPLGGIIDWWPTAAGSPQPTPPAGYEYCDGTAVTTVGSLFLGFTKPDLMTTTAGGTQRVVRGADTTVAYGGPTAFVTGGADTHSHSGPTGGGGAHTHTVNSHTHSVSSDGAHTHATAGGGPKQLFGGLEELVSAGAHSHTGSTGAVSPGTDATGDHTHTLTTTADNNIPAFQELAKIVRVL